MTEQKPMTVGDRIERPKIINTYDIPIKIKGKIIGTGKLSVDHFNHELELEIESEILEKLLSIV